MSRAHAALAMAAALCPSGIPEVRRREQDPPPPSADASNRHRRHRPSPREHDPLTATCTREGCGATPGASCRTRGGRARAPRRERYDAAKDDR